MFFKPSGGTEERPPEVRARAWCDPEDAYEVNAEANGCRPRGATCTSVKRCPQVAQLRLGERLRTNAYGERVITGLGEGVTLRLEGDSFKRVLALGGSEAPDDAGGEFGAAFSSAREGWLGQRRNAGPPDARPGP